MNLKETLKRFFAVEQQKDYYFVCLDCNRNFDGTEAEFFIKHQLDEKHWNYDRITKRDS